MYNLQHTAESVHCTTHVLFLGVLTSRYRDIYNLIGNQSFFFEADVNQECMQTFISSRNKCPQFNFQIQGKNAVITAGRIDFYCYMYFIALFCEVINFSFQEDNDFTLVAWVLICVEQTEACFKRIAC